ncbi:MAG: AI-2E family transporter [Acidobacteriota bacterium]|nr:AI-2E family transporter [Acidobacteriota bacterium]
MALLSIPRRSPKFLDFGTGLIALTASVALLYYGRDFFVTLIISAVFAFILDPAVLLVMKLRVPRGAATPIVIGIAFAAIYLLGLLIWTQVTTLTEDFPTYTSRLSELVDKANGRLDEIEQHTIENIVPKSLRQQQEQIQQKPQEAMKARRRRAGLPLPAQPPAQPQIQEVRIRPDPKPVITTLYGYLSHYLHVIVMASFIPFLVYFMLSWRDRIGDSTLRLFDGEKRYIVERSWIGIADSTRAYVLGNFLLWVFVSSASAIVFFFLEVPYWAIAGPVSGFFSLVPYVGLPLSIIPPVIASVAVPAKFKVVLTVILFTAALHVLSMNFLYAKIIGRRVRLNPLVVTIALLFWGAVWGGIGLILAIPITAGLKAVCDNVDWLKGYGELLGD